MSNETSKRPCDWCKEPVVNDGDHIHEECIPVERGWYFDIMDGGWGDEFPRTRGGKR